MSSLYNEQELLRRLYHESMETSQNLRWVQDLVTERDALRREVRSLKDRIEIMQKARAEA